MEVSELMTTEVLSIDATASVGEALDVLSELNVRHLPVLLEGELTGVLSDRDLRSLGLWPGAELGSPEQLQAKYRLSVASIMSGDPLTVNPSADAREVIDLMLEQSVGAVAVVDRHGGELVGIVSYVDLLREFRGLLD
jgi:CBS domain-containing protein